MTKTAEQVSVLVKGKFSTGTNTEWRKVTHTKTKGSYVVIDNERVYVEQKRVKDWNGRQCDYVEIGLDLAAQRRQFLEVMSFPIAEHQKDAYLVEGEEAPEAPEAPVEYAEKELQALYEANYNGPTGYDAKNGDRVLVDVCWQGVRSTWYGYVTYAEPKSNYITVGTTQVAKGNVRVWAETERKTLEEFSPAPKVATEEEPQKPLNVEAMTDEELLEEIDRLSNHESAVLYLPMITTLEAELEKRTAPQTTTFEEWEGYSGTGQLCRGCNTVYGDDAEDCPECSGDVLEEPVFCDPVRECDDGCPMCEGQVIQ